MITQIHDGDVDDVSFVDVGWKAKHGVTGIDDPPDIAGAEIVRRGHAVLHQVATGRKSGLDTARDEYREGCCGKKAGLFHRRKNDPSHTIMGFESH